MDVDGSLVCTILHPYWHTVEQDLRRKIYQYRHMPADMVLPPYLCLPPILKDPDFRYMGIPVSETVVQTDAKNDIMSNKPNPALVCAACSEPEEFRKHLRKVIAAAKRNGTRLEMILKDLSSVQYHPQRLWEAHKIMAEEVQNW